MTKGRQLILGLLLINSWDYFARTSTRSAAETLVQSWEENLTLLQLYTRPSSQPLFSAHLALHRSSPLSCGATSERGVENKSPCHLHSVVISSGSVVPTEAKGAPGDRRNGKGAAWKAHPSSAVPARHTKHETRPSLPISAARTERPQRQGLIVPLSRRGAAQKNTQVRPQDC